MRAASGSLVASLAALASGAVVVAIAAGAFSGCLLGHGDTGSLTDEDAGTGYEVDFGTEDLASGAVLPGHFHPQGYAVRDIHGRDLKWQVTDCRTCHGQDLSGGPAAGTMGAAPGCDGCHQAGWRTNCTYCHGTPGGPGAPPRDLDGQTDVTKISFPGHPPHTSGRMALPFDCIQCHRKPTDVLTPYHVFDASPRRGENNLSGGLSSQGFYDPVTGVCSNLYCHGNGRGSNGAVQKLAQGPLACGTCHADMTTPAKWATQSGQHNKHLNVDAVNCTICHAATVAMDPGVLSDRTPHVNGKADVVFGGAGATMTFNAAAKSCTGTCHGESHSARKW